MKTRRLLLSAIFLVTAFTAYPGMVLSYFNGNVVYNDVKFEWATSSESNSMLFQVQRSTDGGQFWFTVASLEGSGNSSFTIQYETIENNPGWGDKLYRLRHVDASGSASVSDPISISLVPGPPVSLNVFPNPTTDVITVDTLEPWNGTVSVQNAIGQVIFEDMPMDSRTYVVDVSNLPKGAYYIVLEAGETKMTKKFFKE